MGMSIDEIFSEVGELGRQQFKFITLINILHIYFPFYMLQYSFVARNVDFYCNVPPSQYSDNVSIPQLLLNQSTTEGMSYNILARIILNDINLGTLLISENMRLSFRYTNGWRVT